MRTYTEAEIAMLLLYALPGEPLGEGVYRKLHRAYAALGIEHRDMERNLEEIDLMRLGCNRETARQILYRLEQRETLFAYLRYLGSLGITVLTRLSPDYPHRLRQAMGDKAPLVLYCGGNIKLFSTRCISLVGSRKLREKGRAFSICAGAEITAMGYTYCSGGATGTDSEGLFSALRQGGQGVIFLADSLEKALTRKSYRQAVEQNRLLLVSEFGYDQGFSAQRALSRNRLIHAMGEKTLVAQTDYGTGGTWSGTMENLKQGWSPVFMCNEEPEHPGTRGLIERGAVPILTRELKGLSQLKPEQLSLSEIF